MARSCSSQRPNSTVIAVGPVNQIENSCIVASASEKSLKITDNNYIIKAFYDAEKNKIDRNVDKSHGMIRTEVTCSKVYKIRNLDFLVYVFSSREWID